MFENTKFKNGADYYHKLNFVFNLLIAIPLVPFAFVYLGSIKKEIVPLLSGDHWMLIFDLPVISIVVIVGYLNFRRYRQQVSQIESTRSLRNKMINLHDILVSTYTRFTLAGILTTTAFFLTLSGVHIVVFVIILVLFSLRRPTLKLIVEELALNEEESEILRNKESIQ